MLQFVVDNAGVLLFVAVLVLTGAVGWRRRNDPRTPDFLAPWKGSCRACGGSGFADGGRRTCAGCAGSGTALDG